MSRSSQRSTRVLRNWFVITAFAVLGLVFFFGALNAFRQESAAAEGSAYPLLAAETKTVFVVCWPEAASSFESEHRFRELARVVEPSGVDAVYTTERTAMTRDIPWSSDARAVPIETVCMTEPNSMADAILNSDHRVIIAVTDEDSIEPLLSSLGVAAIPSVADSGDALLVVSTEGEKMANLLRLRY